MRSGLILLLALAGCDAIFRLDPIAPVDATSDDMGPGEGPSWSCAFTGEPVPLLGFGTGDFDPSQRDDKLELLLARDDGDYNIWSARRDSTSEAYRAPTEVLALSTAESELDPALQPGGLHLYFLSTRDSPGGPRLLFEASREDLASAFSAPARVDTAGVSFHGFDVSADGRTLYATTSSHDLFSMSRSTDANRFEGLAILATGVTFPSIAGDELTIYYHRDTMIYRRTRMTKLELFRDEEAITAGGDADISLDGRTLVYKSPTGFAMLQCQ